MIAFAIFTIFVFACGLAIGATHLRDFIDRPVRRAKPHKIPLAVVLHRADAKRLALPTVQRRQAIAHSMIWGRPQPPAEPS